MLKIPLIALIILSLLGCCSESLEVLPLLKGASSSFIMSARLFMSSLAIAITGLLFDGSMRPVALINGLSVSLAFLLYVKLRRSQEDLIEPITETL